MGANRRADGRATVLVVEDEEAIRQGFRALFERAGYKVAVARDGKMALRIARETPPSLAVVDILLPEKTGVDTLRELRILVPTIKIIAVSGGGSHLVAEDCLVLATRAGAHRVFAKPVAAHVLLDAAKELLDQ